MSDFETTARPYAKALFEMASDDGKLDEWHGRLQIAAVIASDDDMVGVFESPSMLANEQSELFLSVYASVKDAPEAGEEFKNFVALLAENGRLAAIPSIALALESLKREAEGKVDVRITSAFKLDSQQEQAIADSLAKKLGKEVSISTQVDESLIAGAIIQAGDMVIDGSARGRLDKLAVALND